MESVARKRRYTRLDVEMHPKLHGLLRRILHKSEEIGDVVQTHPAPKPRLVILGSRD